MGTYSPGMRSAWPLALLGAVAGASAMLAPSAHIHMTAGADAGGEARPTTTVRVLSCENLSNVGGKSITTVLVDFPPNAYTLRPRHPGPVTAFVLNGTLHSQQEGSSAGTFTKGQTWFEPPGAVHLFAENASGTEPAELLAIFVADDGCGPLTIPD